MVYLTLSIHNSVTCCSTLSYDVFQEITYRCPQTITYPVNCCHHKLKLVSVSITHGYLIKFSFVFYFPAINHLALDIIICSNLHEIYNLQQ